MKKFAIFALCILCSIPIALPVVKDGIAKLKLKEEDRILYSSDKGIVLGDVRYKFQGLKEGEFRLGEYREFYSYTIEEELEDIVIAKTPKEAAELGREHIRYVGWLEGSGTCFLLVRYCSETDSWVLFIEKDDPVPSPGGLPTILVINRKTGSMVKYNTPYV